jgi:hypothetical protein
MYTRCQSQATFLSPAKVCQKKGEIKIRKFEKELLGSEKNKCKNHHIHKFGFLCVHAKI